ncbi:MAG: carboxypeptidase-like regulatory domain-containing protein [Candidatus Thermoplasmatota archaeon]
MESRLLALVAVALLAGCNGGGKADSLSVAEQAAEDLEVEATPDTGIIRGIAVDPTIAPIAGVTVRVANMGRNTTTSEQGAFGFDGLAPGLYFLSAEHPDYVSVQQSVDVIAGEQEPPLVRILLTPVPRGDPYIDATQHTLFMDSSTAVAGISLTLGGFTGQGTFIVGLDLAANSTTAQIELRWDPTTPLAAGIQLDGAILLAGDNLESHRWNGGAPLVGRLNTTKGNQSADRVVFDITADRQPLVNVFANQAVEAYVHIFYNMVPRDGWQFGRDGEHPLPP